VSMKIKTRQVDGISIMDCSGRITLGEGSVQLRDAVRDLLAKGSKQILLNLVLNARDAMPNGGQITVETSSCKVQVLDGPQAPEKGATGSRAACLPCVRFTIGDNGKGMDAATRTHLFEAFFTTKGAIQGTGLGLANVHEIVSSNGGLIYVDSAPERGTLITVLLPLVPEAVPPKLNLEAFPIRREPGDPSIRYKEEE